MTLVSMRVMAAVWKAADSVANRKHHFTLSVNTSRQGRTYLPEVGFWIASAVAQCPVDEWVSVVPLVLS
jgi:hypothetical protein